MSTDTILTMLALVLLTSGWQHLRLMRVALRPPPRLRPLDSYPSLTVVRPIKGLDAGLHLNLRAALDNGYTGPIDTIFVLDHEREPALPLVLDAIREHNASGRPGRARVLFSGEPPPSRTGKLHAMIAGLREAEGELVAFADSDIRPSREALDAAVEALACSAGAGAAFAPVVVSSDLRTAGDAAYALTLDGIYGGGVAVTALLARGELPFIMGQLMVFDRSALDAIGGLAGLRGQLVDDMYIGARIRSAGYRNVVSAVPVPVIQQGLSLVEFLRTYRRWIAFSLSGLEPGFTLTSFQHALAFWLGLSLAVVAAALQSWAALALSSIVVVGATYSVVLAHEKLGGAPVRLSHAWVPFALLLVTPLFYPTIFAHRAVAWRGRTYTIDRRGRLAEEAADGSRETRRAAPS